MRPWFCLLPLLLLPVPAAAQRQRTVIVVPGEMTQVVVDTMGTPYEVPFPAAAVYRALLVVYQAFKIPIEVNDSAALQAGSPAFHRQATFAGRQISTWLSCGDGATGPNADSYRVYLHISSTIEPKSPERSVLRTAFLAGAVSHSGSASQAMPCESTGRLEVRIHQEVLKKVAGL
jgi:hypothetical protein